MTVDDFIQDLDQFGVNIQDVSVELAQVGEAITNEVRSKAPVLTGALKSSIRVFVTNNSLAIDMLDYGVFQNYGVKGVTSSRGSVNEPENGISFGGMAATTRFQFGTGNFSTGGRPWGAYYSGIAAQSFFSIETLADDIQETLAQNLIENF
jgi:hypothetical protein